jgi:hypothetical protein
MVRGNFFSLTFAETIAADGPSATYFLSDSPFRLSIANEVWHRETVVSGPAWASSFSRPPSLNTGGGGGIYASLAAIVFAEPGGSVRHTETLTTRIAVTNESSTLFSFFQLVGYWSTAEPYGRGGSEASQIQGNFPISFPVGPFAIVGNSSSEFASFFSLFNRPFFSVRDGNVESFQSCATDGTGWYPSFSTSGSSVACWINTPDTSLNQVYFSNFAPGETRYLDYRLEIRLEAYSVPAPGALLWFALGCAALLGVRAFQARGPQRRNGTHTTA